MKPVFSKNGLAIESGDIRCFYFDPMTFEYTGWSDEYINIGVSMPGHSTDIDPGDEVVGKIAVFANGQWELHEDHRGDIVYSVADGARSIVDYIGNIRSGFTSIAPSTTHDKWDGSRWVVDSGAKRADEIAQAETEKSHRLAAAQQKIVIWQTKLLMGRKLTEAESTYLNSWMDYIDAVTTVDPENPMWPEIPA